MTKIFRPAAVLAGLASIVWLAGCATVPLDEKGLEAEAWELHAKMLTVDTHCDTAMSMTRPNWDVGERHEPGKPGSGLIDLPSHYDHATVLRLVFTLTDGDASSFAVIDQSRPSPRAPPVIG